MKKKSRIIFTVSSVLLIALIIGGFVIFTKCSSYKSEETNTEIPTDEERTEEPTDNGDSTAHLPGDDIEHTTGDAVIEFEEGAEIYFDESLAEYLVRMETGTPAIDENGNYYFDKDGDIVYDMSEEKNLEGVLDTLISIINHFAKESYSIEASHQIQRFYVTYYDRLDKYTFDELIEKLTVCFPKDGANKETLGNAVLNTFGIGSSGNCEFVFRPMKVSEIMIEFYNVAPAEVELTGQDKKFCIYNEWHTEQSSDYERNLEGWLHNIISVVKSNSISEDRIYAAQLLYAGSLANAEYTPDWEDKLISCLTVSTWTFDSLKEAVESEFEVCIDYNSHLQDYFEGVNG